jgi:RNA methyltransferase, TrmH family
MISVNELKYFSSLLHKKYRQKENKFIVEGKKLIDEGIEARFNPEIILTTHTCYETEKSFFNSLKGFRIEILKTPDLLKLTDTRNSQEVVAVFPYLNRNFESSEIKGTIVYLDNISDPGNTGAILRNCDWFGITNVLLSEESVELYNPKVIRAGMGALFHLNIFQGINIEHLLELKNAGYKFICSDLRGKNIFNFNLPAKSVITFSNEAHGPSPGLLKLADEKVSIPSKGRAESLNVASASAVILAQITK